MKKPKNNYVVGKLEELHRVCVYYDDTKTTRELYRVKLLLQHTVVVISKKEFSLGASIFNT